MKKIFIVLILLLLPLVSAININVEEQSSKNIIILEINKPAVFNLKMTNLGSSDEFTIYNLAGMSINPKSISIRQRETKEVTLETAPLGDLHVRGPYIFDYTIKASDGSEENQRLTVKIYELKDAFEIGAGEFNHETNSVDIYIHNKLDFNFDEIDAKFSSAFFDIEKTFFLGPNQRKSFNVQVSKEEFKKLTAGFYTLNAEVQVEGEKANVEGVIKFSEKSSVITEEKNSGFFITTRTIEKINEGNVVANTNIQFKKNFLSQFFTTFSPEPDSVDVQGFSVYYTWSKSLKPGEILEATAKTNWLILFFLVFFIVTTMILIKKYSKVDLLLRKKVSFVRTKGGEFALKVSIFVDAKKYVERVSIVDKLPLLVKVYEHFGGEKPSRIDEKTRRIEWNFEKLEAGEVRMLSYIIYSKVGVLGKFELPTATAVYEKKGEVKETESNKAFFITESSRRKVKE